MSYEFTVDDETEQTLHAALEQWGEYAQRDKAIEESGELIAALAAQHNGQASNAEVIDEIADVQLMILQLAFLFGTKRVEQRVNEKLDRLDHRLAVEGAYIDAMRGTDGGE